MWGPDHAETSGKETSAHCATSSWQALKPVRRLHFLQSWMQAQIPIMLQPLRDSNLGEVVLYMWGPDHAETSGGRHLQTVQPAHGRP